MSKSYNFLPDTDRTPPTAEEVLRGLKEVQGWGAHALQAARLAESLEQAPAAFEPNTPS